MTVIIIVILIIFFPAGDDMCAEVTYKGGCLCGGFKYTYTGERFQLTNCHCGLCHKATGAALFTVFVIPRSCVTITEAATDTFYESSEGVERHFCNRCGTSIYDDAPASADTLTMSVSTLEEYPETSVGGEMFVNYKVPWHTLYEGAPRYGEWDPSWEKIVEALLAWRNKQQTAIADN